MFFNFRIRVLLGVVVLAVISAFGKLRQENQEFKVILCYIVSWRSAWDT